MNVFTGFSYKNWTFPSFEALLEDLPDLLSEGALPRSHLALSRPGVSRSDRTVTFSSTAAAAVVGRPEDVRFLPRLRTCKRDGLMVDTLIVIFFYESDIVTNIGTICCDPRSGINKYSPTNERILLSSLE